MALIEHIRPLPPERGNVAPNCRAMGVEIFAVGVAP